MSNNPGTTLWNFFVHVVVATVIFVLIAVPAVLLDFAVKWLSSHGVSDPIVGGLQALEYIIFTADGFLFLVLIGKTTYRAAMDL